MIDVDIVLYSNGGADANANNFTWGAWSKVT